MTLNIDARRPLRRPLELQALVQAVVDADPVDENNSVEWKSTLDLTDATGRFALARAILGLANRMPEEAATSFEGLGYVIVGAKPGEVGGIPRMDGADLDQGLSRYLGTDGPAWTPTFLDLRGQVVLVVVVEAPQWGDSLQALHAGHGKVSAGVVFVRSQSSTRPANPDDLRRLEQRLLRGQVSPTLDGLKVGFRFETTLGLGTEVHHLFVPSQPPEADIWLAKRQTAIQAWHNSVVDERMKPIGAGRPQWTFVPQQRPDRGIVKTCGWTCFTPPADHLLVGLGRRVVRRACR